jgi:hypothetical protein
MIFFKAVFALYLVTIALAAPKRELVEVGDVGMFRENLCLLCTILSKQMLMTMAMALLKTSPRTWAYFKGIDHPPFLVI